MNYILSLFNKIKPLLIFSLFFFFALILTYPSIIHLSDRLIGDGGDNYQYFGFQYIAENNLKQFRYPFSFTNMFRYPVGFEFGAGFDAVLGTLFGALLSLVTTPIFGYNFMVLLLLSLNAFSSFYLFRYISKSSFLGIIGGLIYGYSSYTIVRTAGHLNLLSIGGFSLFLLSILKLNDEGFNKKNIALFYISIVYILFSSFQYGLLLMGSIIFCLPILMIFFRQKIFELMKNAWINRRNIALFCLPFLGLIFAFLYPMLKFILSGNFVTVDRSNDFALFFSPSLKDFILPNPKLPLLIVDIAKFSDSFPSMERVVFVGWLELILLLTFVVFYKNTRKKLFLLTLIFIFFILSLGFINPETHFKLPYYFLSQFFPFSFIPEAGRFFVIMQLFIVTCIILLLKQILPRNKQLFIIFSTLFLTFFILERLPSNYWLSPIFTDKPFIKSVKDQQGAATLDLPINYWNATYNMFSYAYQKKIVSGYFNYPANTKEAKSFIENSGLDRFICKKDLFTSIQQKEFISIDKANKELVRKLKASGIDTIVVHKNNIDDHAQYYSFECTNVRMQTSLLAPQILMPNITTEKTTKVMSLFFPAIPTIGDTITFPYDGVFYLDGLYMHPDTWLPLHIYQNGKEVTEINKWKDREENNATADPYISFTVKKGSKISFSFDKNNNTAYSIIQIWYRYIPTEKTQIKDKEINSLIKIYEDDDAAVFRIQ